MKPCFVQASDTGGDERYSAIRIDHNSRSDIPCRYTITEDGGLAVIKKVTGDTIPVYIIQSTIISIIVLERKDATFSYPNRSDFEIHSATNTG